MGLAEMKGYLKNKKQPTSINKVQAALRVISRLSIQLHDFSVFRIGAADGGMIHGIHVYGDDVGLL